MGVCERCTENGNCAWQNHDETICREKPAFPATNYDRIRAMSMEEMAVWLAAMLGVNPFDGTGNDYRKWLDWLKQEVSTNG